MRNKMIIKEWKQGSVDLETIFCPICEIFLLMSMVIEIYINIYKYIYIDI